MLLLVNTRKWCVTLEYNISIPISCDIQREQKGYTRTDRFVPDKERERERMNWFGGKEVRWNLFSVNLIWLNFSFCQILSVQQ